MKNWKCWLGLHDWGYLNGWTVRVCLSCKYIEVLRRSDGVGRARWAPKEWQDKQDAKYAERRAEAQRKSDEAWKIYEAKTNRDSV